MPSRDLSQEEFERLGPLEQRTVWESGGWEAIKPTEKPAAPDTKKDGE